MIVYIFEIKRTEIMEAIKLNKVIEKDGEITLKGIPCKKGQKIEMILLLESSSSNKKYARNMFKAVKLKTKGFKFNRDCANER